jgi:hypothetical protein
MLVHQANFCFKWMHPRLWLIVVALLCSCKDEKPPKGILTEPQMVEVLKHLYLSEERLGKISVPYDSMTKLLPYVKGRIYEEAGVSDSLFKASMQYYMAHPKRLEYIYTALVDSLSLEEQGKPHDASKNVQIE